MEPITHLMTGACLARAGLNRKAAYATLAMTLAAEAPDLDTLWSLDGPVAAFAHHRGITHTFIAIPFEACVIVTAVWCFHKMRFLYATFPGPPKRPLNHAQVRWGRLWLFAVLALLSHLLLDYTNNYGVRPFYPFNAHWYAGSIVFIIEPVLFLALFAGLIMPYLFGLINSEVGARRPPFRGRSWATAALLAMIGLWAWRLVEQQKAIQLASSIDLSQNQPQDSPAVPILRIQASPYPINPYRWHLVLDTPDFYQLSTADTLSNTLAAPSPTDVFHKPQTTVAALAAKRSPLGEAYLDWSSYPFIVDTTDPTQDTSDPGVLSTVTFRDLRFLYDVPFLKGRSKAPLTATVTVDANRKVVRMAMGDRSEP